MPIHIAILILSSLVLTGCAKPLTLVLPKEKPLELAIYSHGSLEQECTIAPGSSQFSQLEVFLVANRDNWEPTLVTFAPAILVTGSDFSRPLAKVSFSQSWELKNQPLK